MAFPLSQSRAAHVGVLKRLIKLGVSIEAKDHMRVYTAFPCALGLGCSKASLLTNFLGAVSGACQSASVAGELGVMLQQKRPPIESWQS